LEPQTEVQPYSTYDLSFEAPGSQSVIVRGVQVFPGEDAIQEIDSRGPIDEDYVSVHPAASPSRIDIPANTLWGNEPAKIPEDEIKPLPNSGEGFVVLDSVVIPQYIVVHDGTPSSSATDYWIPYADYIKNVASSEIYATWPEAAILANVLAIMSFTLNRVYTEWYRSKGYGFTITSSTAYDQKFSYGRTIYTSISQAVDAVLTNYITRPDILQPLLTQYCDGRRVTCPNWMSQWGSKDLADQGYQAIAILRNYYGYSIYLDTASRVSGVPSSYPGSAQRYGSRGSAVRTIQRQLNRIAKNYPAIGTVSVDGIYGRATEAAVRKFQSVFNLTADGIVGRATWYKLSQIYTAVTGIAEG
jgi:peptidoglycan hydrolase-like protein with peptidoglycan-binding domain